MLVALKSSDVLAHRKIIRHCFVIRRSQALEIQIIAHNRFLRTMIDDVRACGGLITKVAPNNRLL